ncbi:MAG: trypsin-like peptidase domain-containing protein, partial [Planctomycetes bacterium]|nr:trypsin-like peptidase domain-containing protein [Planctomycetota bacterium]
MAMLRYGIFIVLGVVALNIFLCPVYAAGAGDLCLDAILLSESTPYFGDSSGATGSSTSSCSYNDTKDVWHSFTPTQSGNYTISLCGSSFDTTLSVYDACGGTELACNDDMCSVYSEVVVNLTTGLTYLIRVAGYNDATGPYVLEATKRPSPPVNDEIGGAIEVFENTPYAADTLGATGDTFSSCADGYDFYDLWHVFVPTVTTEYSISLCNSSFDTTLSLFDDQPVEIGCNDDDCGSQSKLNMVLTAGESYYIRIAGYDGDTGDYMLNVTRYLQTPLNDECSNSIEVFLDAPWYGTTVEATGISSSSCSVNDYLDVWHHFTPSQSGYHTVSLCGSSFNTTLAVYDSCSGSELACNDDLCDLQSEVIVDFTAGLTYKIRIAGKNSKTGDYVIRVSERFSQPPNDECSSAIEVFEDIVYDGNSIGALGDTGSSCGYYFDFYDVWHSFTPTQSKDYLLSLCGSDFDTTLSVYDACMGLELACNDDSCEKQSELVISLTAGQNYLIRVAGYDGAMGDYSLVITESTPPPANDNCQDAIALDLNVPYMGSTINASGSSVSTCSDEDTLDVWFSFAPPESGNYEIDLCESQFDTTLAVYDACGGTELACNDDFCLVQSRISIYLEAGSTYLIRVAGYRGAMGTYTIVVGTDCLFVPEPAAPSPDDLSFDVEPDTTLAWNSGAVVLQNMSQSQIIIKGIYGTDDRQDEYQILDTQLKAVGDSTAAMISLYDLTDNGNGTYSIPSTTLAETYLADYGWPLCPTEPFINQPSPALCTGFLVAPDMIATTGHCIGDSSICSDMAFVFGFTMINSSTPVVTFDASDVYFCSEIVARLQTADSDWALIRLDRDVLNHAPLMTRRSGKIADSRDLAVIGHTLGLPRKYADNAWVQENLSPGSFQANMDTFIGNSGSPVINMDTYEVEGVLFAGNPDFVADGDCDR